MYYYSISLGGSFNEMDSMFKGPTVNKFLKPMCHSCNILYKKTNTF